MRRTIYRLAKSTLSVLLCIIFIIPLYAAPGSSAYDYSDSNENMYTNSVAPSVLVELITGSSYTDFEKSYLDLQQDYYLKYNTQISTDHVTLEAVGTTIFVTATVYPTKTKNNSTIRWIPVSATCNGIEASFTQSNGKYECQFSNVEPDTSYPIKVNYSASINIPERDANALINKVYNDALDVKTILNTYESSLEKYNNNVKAYEEYQKRKAEYLNALNEYNEYLEKKNVYQKQLQVYQQYLRDYEAYEAEYKKYQTYLQELAAYNEAYDKYLKELEAFQADSDKYTAYLEYLAKIEQCESFLANMDHIYFRSSIGHSMYETIIGGTVDTVLNNKNQLIGYGGVSPEDIDNAGNATEILRTLLREYKTKTTNEEKFNWYKTNYRSLLSAFSLLYSSLYSLMKNRAVYVEMTKRDKTTRFYQFISQMYVITTNLDDEAALSKDWYIYDIKTKTNLTLMEVLEPDLFFEDGNSADPGNVSWPSEVEKVELPSSLTLPTKPVTVYEPFAPEKVEAPTEPEAVPQPIEPAVVSSPGNKPTQPTLTTVQKSLLTELENGSLKKRMSVTAPFSYPIQTTINTFLTAADIFPYPVVTFVNYNGTVIVDLVLKDPSDALKVTPAIPESPYEVYTFEYWETTGGTRVDFESVNRNMTVYAHFSSSAPIYEITWVIKDKVIKTSCSYGETPSYPGTTDIPSDPMNDYFFIGWDKDISPAFENTTYTAEYSSKKRIYNIEWVIDNVIYDTTGEYGTIPVYPDNNLSYFTDDYYYRFVGWDKELAPITGSTRYTAVFERENLVVEQEGKNFSIIRSDNGISIALKDESGSLDISNIAINACNNKEKLSIVSSGESTIEIPYSFLESNLENGLVFDFGFGTVSEKAMSCSISVSDKNGNTVSTNGIVVKLFADTDNEYKLYGVSGSETKSLSFFKQGDYFVFTSDGSCSSYYFDVVEDNPEDEYFTVNFYVEGKLYSTGKYKFGEQLVMPAAPTKEGTEEYDYSFTGWSPTVVNVVTKNMDYNGSFKETKKASSGDYNVSPYTKLYPIHLIFIGFAIVVVLTVIISFIVKFILIKKSKLH